MAFEQARHDALTQLHKQPELRFLWISADREELPHNAHLASIDDAITNDDQYDVAIIDCEISTTKNKSRHIISQLRDMIAKKIVIFYRDNALSTQDFIDLGFIRLSQEEPIYGFDLYNYRQTPDWLNSENWANPERFDQDRW